MSDLKSSASANPDLIQFEDQLFEKVKDYDSETIKNSFRNVINRIIDERREKLSHLQVDAKRLEHGINTLSIIRFEEPSLIAKSAV